MSIVTACMIGWGAFWLLVWLPFFVMGLNAKDESGVEMAAVSLFGVVVSVAWIAGWFMVWGLPRWLA
jgi:hypothetical protein